MTNLIRTIVVVLLSTPSNASPAVASDLDHLREALDVIGAFAERMCTRVEPAGRSVELSGSAKAELSGLLDWLADLEIEGAAEGRIYEGVLQKDLAEALKNTKECRVKIVASLQERVISIDRIDPPPQKRHNYETVLAGMLVRCTRDISAVAADINNYIKDSSAVSRMMAFGLLQLWLKQKAMKSSNIDEFECIFDDDLYYLRAVPLGSSEGCHRYRETYATVISEGKKVTQFGSTC